MVTALPADIWRLIARNANAVDFASLVWAIPDARRALMPPAPDAKESRRLFGRAFRAHLKKMCNACGNVKSVMRVEKKQIWCSDCARRRGRMIWKTAAKALFGLQYFPFAETLGVARNTRTKTRYGGRATLYYSTQLEVMQRQWNTVCSLERTRARRGELLNSDEMQAERRRSICTVDRYDNWRDAIHEDAFLLPIKMHAAEQLPVPCKGA